MHEAFIPWLFAWMRHLFHTSLYTFLIYSAALLSPLLWFLKPNRKYLSGPVFILWILNYINVWIWLLSSPEPRFGLAFHVLSIGLPLITLLETVVLPAKKIQLAGLAFTWMAAIGYGINIFAKQSTYPFTLADCWLKPLKDYRYFRLNDKKTFPYRQLNNGARLYIPDNTHTLINADLPCRNDTLLNVELRGPGIESGFRVTGNKVKTIYPYIK